MKKKIIWSLFDSETAITQELNSDLYTVYSIGLPSSSAITDNFIKIDLSKRSCLKKLKKLPKPDIIFASPPCESWVKLSIGSVCFYNRNFNEYNLYWQKNFKPNNYAKNHRKARIIGQKTAYWTMKIIKKFNPELWCIENGSSSLIFKYLYLYHDLQGHQNKAVYSAYDKLNFPQKPTVFYSNLKIKLNDTSVKSNLIVSAQHTKDKDREMKTYAERSRVPLKIYIDILNHYEGKGQLTLF